VFHLLFKTNCLSLLVIPALFLTQQSQLTGICAIID